MIRVGLVGARGYVGAEVVRLLASHPAAELAFVTSSTEVGRAVEELLPGAPPGLRFTSADPAARLREPIDALLLALPNGASEPWVRAVDEIAPRTLLIDLGSDHRLDSRFVYGLPARRRESIRASRRVANPGCYATAMQMAIAPLVPWLVGEVHAFGVSGYSGAGTSPSPKNDPNVLRDNVLPYSLVDHVHELEVARELGHPVRLLPHVAPFFRGITVTVSGRFSSPRTARDMVARITEHWKNEPLVVVSEEAPLVRDVALRHEVFVGGARVAEGGRAFAVVATVDNLLGGAATTALRNVNLALGRRELDGIVP